jgi:hypothetical protein
MFLSVQQKEVCNLESESVGPVADKGRSSTLNSAGKEPFYPPYLSKGSSSLHISTVHLCSRNLNVEPPHRNHLQSVCLCSCSCEAIPQYGLTPRLDKDRHWPYARRVSAAGTCV